MRNQVRDKKRSIETKTTLDDGTQIEYNKPISDTKQARKGGAISAFAGGGLGRGRNAMGGNPKRVKAVGCRVRPKNGSQDGSGPLGNTRICPNNRR